MKVSSLPYMRIDRAVGEHGLGALVEWIEFCAANDLGGVELAEPWLRRLEEEDIKRLMDVLEYLPLEISALNVPEIQTNQPPGPGRQEAIRQVVRSMELALRLGTTRVMIGSGNWGYYDCYRMSRDEAVDNTVATIEACIPEAAARGLRLLLENRPGWLPLRAEVAEQMLQRLPAEHVSLNLDTGSALREGQSLKDFLERDALLRRIDYVHLKSIRFEGTPEAGRWNQTRPFDQSHLDYRYIFSRLASVGFDGWICYASDLDVGMVGIIAGAEFVRRTWEATVAV